MKSVLFCKRVVLTVIIASIIVFLLAQIKNDFIPLLRGYTGGNISVVNSLTNLWTWSSVQHVAKNENPSLKSSSGQSIQNIMEREKTQQQPAQETFVTDKPANHTVPWTVLMTLNSAFFDFYQNWLWHYQQLHLPANIPVVVIAEDNKLFEKAETLNTEGVTVKKSHLKPIKRSLVFNTPLFKKYMSRRALYILEYLQKGFDVLHVDVDSVWLKNPFPYLVGDFDIWGQVDKPPESICMGFIALKSNEKVVKFVQAWIDAMQTKTNKLPDQEVFNRVLNPGNTLRINKLPSDEFPSGKLYFNTFNDATRAKTVVVHNNYIIGHDQKKNRFIKFNLWKVE